MSTFGPAYEAPVDRKRIFTQMERIRDLMLSAAELNSWLTLSELEKVTHYPECSISAQLRHLRKKAFGSYIIEKRRRGNPEKGLWEYRLSKPVESELLQERLPL